MAGILSSLIAPSAVALSAATPKTVLQIVAPTNQRLLIKKIGFFFDGTSTTAVPVIIKLIKQSTAGTGGTSATPNMIGAGSETLQATGQYNIATAEPTGTTIIDHWEVHPQQGFETIIPLDQPYPVVGGGRMGLVITAPAAVNVLPKFIYEE